MLFASNVNRLLSFRMSEVMVKYLGEALAEKKHERAAAIVKAIGLVEALTSVIAYLILLALTPWAASTFAKDPATAPLFAFYGLTLLSNLIYETSTGILQATDRFDRVAVINLIQSIITVVMIFADFLLKRGIVDVLTAYLVGKTFTGIALIYFAVRELNKILGKDWYRASLRQLTDWRSIGSFAINTNLNGTVTLFVRDNAPLYLAAFGTVTEVGYFKLALSLVNNGISLPIQPFIWPTYAELTRSIALHQWQETKQLLRRVSAIAGGWNSRGRWWIGRIRLVAFAACVWSRRTSRVFFGGHFAGRLWRGKHLSLESSVAAGVWNAGLSSDGDDRGRRGGDRIDLFTCAALRLSG